MTLDSGLGQQVRERAHRACEYCGVTEVDAAGMLSVDHYRPSSHDGTNDFDNLIYCCTRCNNHKGDYWPTNPSDPALWNPRREPSTDHLLLLADGSLHPISPIGSFTLNRLRLNRSQLVDYRLRKLQTLERARQLQESLNTLNELRNARIPMTDDQRLLLERHRQLLEQILQELDPP